MLRQNAQPDYRNDWQARESMISDAAYSHGRVKDPVAHINRKMRRYGRPYRDAYGLAYEIKPHHCLAVAIEEIDAALCAQYNWEPFPIMRARDDAKMVALLNRGTI